MKILIGCLPLFLLFSTKIAAQSVFSVDLKNKADVKVFVVKTEAQADLKVFKLNSSSKANNNNGKWFFTKYESQAKFNIYFVDLANQADVKVFFVKYESQAGWRNKSKMHYFY